MHNRYYKEVRRNGIKYLELSKFKKFLILYFSNYKSIRKYIGGYWKCIIEDSDCCWSIVNKTEIYNVSIGYSYKTILEYYPINFFGTPTELHNNYSNIIRMEKLNRLL
jgi:hypothetical protein